MISGGGVEGKTSLASCHLRRVSEEREQVMPVFRGLSFQAEAVASYQALRQQFFARRV